VQKKREKGGANAPRLTLRFEFFFKVRKNRDLIHLAPLATTFQNTIPHITFKINAICSRVSKGKRVWVGDKF
jgi:hypothetical protein